MTIGYIGTDQTRASLSLRERLALSDDNLGNDNLGALLATLRAEPAIDEAAVLSTCNRIEIYIAAAEPHAALARAAHHLSRITAVAPGEIAAVLEQRTAAEAARHLFAVAAGLRSLAVGETQIQTQVRAAFEHAAACDAAGAELGALARMAVTCGKRVRAETALGTTDTSVSGVAVAMARRRLGGLQGRSALLIGAGRINEVSAQLLRDAGIGSLVVVSRTREAADTLAASCGGRGAAMEDLAALLHDADLAIAATRAPQPLVLPATIIARPATRPLLLYDIAVPRNVDPAVGAVAAVELVDMDTLRAIGPGTPDPLDGIAAAWTIVDECVEHYLTDTRTRRAVPLIAQLRAHVDGQKEAELARTLAALEHLDPEDRAAVALLAHRLVNRMFHHLASRLKAAATVPEADTYLEALSFLFESNGTEYRTITAPEEEKAAGNVPSSASDGETSGLLGGGILDGKRGRLAATDERRT